MEYLGVIARVTSQIPDKAHVAVGFNGIKNKPPLAKPVEADVYKRLSFIGSLQAEAPANAVQPLLHGGD